MRVDASYSAQGSWAHGTLSVTAGSSAVEHVLQPTEQTVGEPNQRRHIDNFASRLVGWVEIAEPGVHEVSMAVRAREGRPVQFQWLWLTRQ